MRARLPSVTKDPQAAQPSAEKVLVRQWVMDWFSNVALDAAAVNRINAAAADLVKRLEAARKE